MPAENRSRILVVAVVVSTNERRWLAECLSTLLASRIGPDVDLHVVLVDNASTDGSADFVAASFPTVQVIRNVANEGFAGANNRGFRNALARGADHVLLINADTRTPPDLLAGLVAFMRQHPGYGIVGPLQYAYRRDGSWISELNAWSRTALAAGEGHVFIADGVDHPSPAGPLAGRAPATLEHAYIQGCALLVRTDVLRAVGLFDPTYHTYYEETDLCRRARWARWRVALLLDLGIQHAGGGTGASRYRRRHMLRNRYYFLLTDPEWTAGPAVRLALRWLRQDLTRRGVAPAATWPAAMADLAAGLAWLATHSRAALCRRREHRILSNCGAVSALAAKPSWPGA